MVGRVPRLLGIADGEARGVTQGLTALVISAFTALVAGLTLASIQGSIEALPGLLILVPGAIALRGNVFGALGSRLSTSIHTGTFRLSGRLDTVVGQNVMASMVVTLAASLALAILAKLVAVAFGVSGSIGVGDYIVVSVVGGLLASVLVLAITLALTAGSVRYDWDLDNMTAPLVTATGDVVTLPSLVIAMQVIGNTLLTAVIAGVCAFSAIIFVVWALRSPLDMLKRIVLESLPVLAIAAVLSLLAGVLIERRTSSFLSVEALLVLLPGYLGTGGALGGILSSRLSSKFHLGLVPARALPSRVAMADVRLIFLLAVPVFALNGFIAHLGATWFGRSSPGSLDMIAVAVFGGMLATACVAAVAYYGTMVAVRVGLDPDNHGIPLVTSTLDLVGAFTLIFAIVVVGVA